MEPFLPSEIARLVYGYLDEAKCDEAARSFLEHCSHLSECLAANKEGKGFNTRPAGYSLKDILDEYCEIRSMVAECLQKLPKNSADKLWQCDSLIEQLRYLIDSSQGGQMLLVSIRVPPKESPAKGTSSSVTPTLPTHNHLRIIGSSNRIKRTAVRLAHGTKQRCSKDADDMLSSISNSMLSVEATPLENLPGTSGNMDNKSMHSGEESVNIQNVSQSGHTAGCEHNDPVGSVISHEASLLKPSIYPNNQCQKCCDKGRTSKYHQHSCVRTSPAVDSPNSSAIEDGPSCFSSPKRKHSCSSKRKSGNPTPMKGIHTPLKSQTPCKVRRSHTDNSESSENIDFSVLTQALLDNTELHKKIAENINRVIHKPGPGESLENTENHPFSSTVGDPGSAETYPMVAGCNSVVSSCDGMLQELNQTIKTVVEQTEQDPVFERFLNEIIAPLEEEMTPSSVDLQSEDDNAFPDLAVTTKPARNVNIDTHDATSTPNKKSSAKVTGCSKDQQVFQERRLEDSSGMLTNDVPLKQRLRSATQHKYDTSSGSTSVNSTASSGKEKKREGTSLEDQNAAAIQCIVDAKISTQSIFEVSHSHQLQSNVCPSMPTSTVDSQTFSTTTSGGNCHEKLGYFAGQLMKDGSVVTDSLQKEISQISDGRGGSVDVGSSNNMNIVNESVQNAEVILLDANLTFLDSNASFSLNTGTNSNFVTNSSSVTTQLSAPLVATSQPSVSAAATNQLMTVMLPGTTGAVQQAATLGGIPLYPQCEQAAHHSLATNSSSQVVAITIPGPQKVNSAVPDQMSTVIMCGSDGIIPQFITVPHPDSSRGNYLMSGSSGPCRMPIVPRGALIPKARTVHQKDAKPGPSKHAGLSKSQRKKHISSSDEKKVVRNTVAVSTYSTVSKPSAVVGVTSSADNNRDNGTLKSPDTGQQSSAGCGLSLPSIVLESPETKMLSVTAQKSRVTPTQDNGQEKMSGALNLKEASESCLNQKPVGIEQDKGIRSEKKLNADGNESVKSKSELILQSVGKYPPSPQLMTLVNLSRNPAISGCPPSALVPGAIGETIFDKVSEVQLTQKPRETPQSTTSQSRTSMDSKRLSLSTPRRHRHVRVLDFTTPPKARTVPKDLQRKEPSPNTVEKVTKTSRRTIRNGANKARSTLFKSHNESETSVCDIPLSTVISSVSSACSNNYLGVIPPIATRSPLPRLSGGWDNAAGVGQIICDESGSDFSVTETQCEVNEMDKQSEVTKGSTKLLKNREAGCKMTEKLSEECLVSVKSRQSSRKAWDFELRASLNAHDEGVQLSSNDSSSTTNKSTKRRKTKTKSRRRSSHVTEEEVRSLEEHLNKDEHTDSGNLIKNQGSKNGVSENTSSNLIIPFNTSTKSSEKTDYDIGAKNQNRDLNTVIAPIIKEKVECLRKNVEPTSESDHTSLELVEKLPVMFNSKYKSCVPLPKLSKKKDVDQPTDLLDNHGASDKGEVAREPDGKEQVKGVQGKEILALETSNSKKADLSKSSSSSTMGVQRKEVLVMETSDSKKTDLSISSDSPTMETVSSSTSVGSLLTMASCFQVGHSPKEQKAGERRILDHSMHIHQSPNSVAIETIVTHANDLGNSASLVVVESGIGCVLASGAASVADSQPVPVSQSEELVSSTSGFYPSEPQNKDIQASSHKYSSNKEQSLANIPDKPLLKISGTQQVCDTVNMSDPQAKVVTSPILDTPRKINDPSSNCWGTAYMSIPLTPRLRSPHPDDTPVTKQVNGNSCVIFSLIETPSFPPTPNIAVTPQSYHMTQSTPSSAARSTDYSAGSAYYKPSDKLDCSISAKPLEQVLIEECRKLESTITAQTSNAYNESHMEDTGRGQQLSLSFTDKAFGEATSGTDFQVKVNVGKDMVLPEVDEGQGCVVGGTQSSKKRKRAKEVTKKIGVRNHKKCDKSKDKKITRKKAAGSLSKKSSGIEDKPSEMYTLQRRKSRTVSGTAHGSCDVEQQSLRGQTAASDCTNRDSVYISRTGNKSSNFDDKPSETHTTASFSAQKKARTVNKNREGQVDFLVDTVSSEKQQWEKETTKKSGVRGHGNSAVSKGAKIARKKKTGSPSNKASAMEDKPSESCISSRRKTRPVSGTAYKSGDFASVSSKKKVRAAGKRKARPNSRASKKRSNLEDEPSETQENLCKELEGKTEAEIIQRCLDAAHSKLFGYSSPSDDSDFESSNDFEQIEVETKTVLSNDGKDDERCTELKTAKESGTEQETETGHSSKLCSAYLGDGSTDVQNMVEPQRQDEVKCVSGLSLTREKSPHLPSSYREEQMREIHADRTVNCESLLCHSEMSGFEIFPERDLSINDSNKSPLCFTNDSVDTNLHTSSGKNITLNNKLVEKKHCAVAKLKDVDVSSNVPNSVVKECEERDGRALFTSKSVPSSSEHSGSIENNPMCSDQDMDARNQLRDKEGSSTKTALAVPTKLIRGTGPETTQAKKNSHLSVEAIADRLTREKIAVQAHPLTQHPIGQPLTDDSNSEDFPVLHLTADYDSLSESMNLSQVESRLAKLHGVEGATSDVVAVESAPVSASDVRRDLERTPNRFQGVQSNVKLSPTVDMLEHERQELVRKEESSTGKMKHGGVIANKKPSATERLENTNKKIRALLGDDVSPIKIVTEASEVSKDTEHGILNEVLPTTVKHNSPIKGTLDVKLEVKPIERSGISTAVKEMVQEKEVFLKQNKVCESAEMKTTNGSKFCQTSTIEVTDAVDTVGSRMEGLPSQGTSMKYEHHQVSSNEAYIEIRYADEGPEEHNLVFEDISNFSLTFELGEHLAEGVETYKCTISEFQELFCASPKECTSRSESCESDQLDVKRRNTTINCTVDRCLGYVTSNKDRDRELFHEGRSAELHIEEHKMSSSSPCYKKSEDFSCDRMRSSHSYKGSPPPVYRRRTLSANPGRKSQCFDHRAPSSSSSPVSVKSKLSTFSPLNELYNEYLKDERESTSFVSHRNKRDQYFNFRSHERLPFGHRGRGRTRYYDRHIHSQRVLVHSSRESRRTSSSSSSHGHHDRRSVQEVRATEMGSAKFSGGTALLIGAPTAVKDMEQQSVAVDTQIKGVMCGRQKVLADDESPEEGELLDEDSMQELDEDGCNDKHVVWFQKHPSSVGNVQAEKLSEDTPSILKGNMNASDIASDYSLEQNRSVEGKPSQEPEKARKKSVQKEGSFAGPSAGRALPPKKRKASSEELSVQVEKRMRTDGPQALLKKVDLDHLLDFVHGEKLG